MSAKKLPFSEIYIKNLPVSEFSPILLFETGTSASQIRRFAENVRPNVR